MRLGGNEAAALGYLGFSAYSGCTARVSTRLVCARDGLLSLSLSPNAELMKASLPLFLFFSPFSGQVRVSGVMI